MMGEATAKKCHFTIALYLKECMKREKDEFLFEVVHHFNKVPEFITDPAQRLELANLNLEVIIGNVHRLIF
jgi:hypothetical protein